MNVQRLDCKTSSSDECMDFTYFQTDECNAFDYVFTEHSYDRRNPVYTSERKLIDILKSAKRLALFRFRRFIKAVHSESISGDCMVRSSAEYNSLTNKG